MIYLFMALPLAAAAIILVFGLRTRIKYNVRADYRYAFRPEQRLSCRVADGMLQCEGLSGCAGHSLLLAVRVQCGWRGRVRDPYVRLRAGSLEQTQYFERGARGVRFVDLTPFAGCDQPLIIASGFCRLDPEAELLSFAQPSLSGAILVVAPHPDDAELGAFGLYSRDPASSTIVTITAGEGLAGLRRQYIAGLDEDRTEAVRRKGLTRALDAVTAPRWGGVEADSVIQLGYFNDTLTAMAREPDRPIGHPHARGLKPQDFRTFNRWKLATDLAGDNRWRDLIMDLTEVIARVRPSIVVTTDPDLDPHPDHVAATQAVKEALARAHHVPDTVLYYVTHVRGTDEYPFGPPHCAAGPAPWFEGNRPERGYFSLPLSAATQREKICAMDAMHDLRSAARLEKRIKRLAQRWVAGRRWPCYGEHGYFQTAVKANEVFLTEP